MARKLRMEYPGAVYHVMNRGDRREEIFRDGADRKRFAATLGEACAKIGWQVHALCLMRNDIEMTEHLGAEHYGAERAATVEAHAEGIVAEELQRRRWGAAELSERAKGDPEKLALAVRLRAETAVTVKWIAGRLQMGAPGYLNHLLYRERNEKGE